MTTEIKVPTLGESVSQGTVIAWLKQEGEAVAKDEAIVELETDKVSIEVPSPVAGVLTKQVAQEGDDVDIGALLAEVDENATATVTSAPPKAEAKAEATPEPAKAEPAKAEPAKAESAPAPKKASGHNAQISRDDFLKQAASPAVASGGGAVDRFAAKGERPLRDGEERVKMTKLRKIISTRLKETQETAAMLSTFNEVDMGPIMNLRAQYQPIFEKKHGIRLGFMGFFVKATTMALQELPAVNAEIHGDEIIYKNYYDIGIAVGTEKGLVVPVLRDADKKSIPEIEAEIRDFGLRARDGKLTPAEMTGGSYTITNGGVFGSLLSTPIINPPQSGILGMHKIQKRPVVDANGDIVAANMMYLAHSYDHRIIDGREAVTFLVRIKELLEDPSRIVLDI